MRRMCRRVNGLFRSRLRARLTLTAIASAEKLASDFCPSSTTSKSTGRAGCAVLRRYCVFALQFFMHQLSCPLVSSTIGTNFKYDEGGKT